MRRALLFFSLAVLAWALVAIARPAATAPVPRAAADRSWEEQVFRIGEARRIAGTRFLAAVERAKRAAAA